MDELQEAISYLQQALDAAEEFGLSEVIVPLEDALYIFQHYFMQEKGIKL